jgi:type VI secretion system protein ImpG
MRLDDEFPEITGAFLGLLYPHYLAPIPACTIARFVPDPDRVEATSGMEILRHSLLYTPPTGGVRCRFRTCYDLTLWPVEVTGLDVIPLDQGEPACPPDAHAAVRIQLGTLGSRPFGELSLENVRFFLDGDSSLTHQLYELLFRDSLGLVVRPGESGARNGVRSRAKRENAVYLSPAHLRPVGFDRDEGLLAYDGASQLGYRLLQEYFCFPEKFLFAEVSGLPPAPLTTAGRDLEILVLLDEFPLDLEAKLGPENLKLGCTPAVNIFPHQAEPLRLSHTQAEYQVLPDSHAPAAYEVLAIQSVETVEPATGAVTTYRPFYSLSHGDPEGEEVAFWQASRRASLRKDDPGTEVFLCLVDRSNLPVRSLPGETLIVQTLCSNRDLPPELPLGEGRGTLQIEGRPGVARVESLRKPTAPLRTSLQEESHWRLISLLSLNHLSLVGEGEVASGKAGAGGTGTVGGSRTRSGPQAFRELLALLDFADSAATRQRIAGLVDVRARRVLRRVTADGNRIFSRGLEVELEFDESKYAGSGVFLFASVLEHFLGLYTSINSFTQTVARVRQREGVLKRWPPRAGEIQLV